MHFRSRATVVAATIALVVSWISPPGGPAAHERDFRHDHLAALTERDIERRREWMDAWIPAHGQEVTRQSPPTSETNCHGKTFDDGKSWIDAPSNFLRNCTEVARADAKAGDVVVYRHRGQITHTGRIKRKDGETIIVHSQFGDLGDFDHPIDKVLQGEPYGWGEMAKYGTPTIYRCP